MLNELRRNAFQKVFMTYFRFIANPIGLVLLTGCSAIQDRSIYVAVTLTYRGKPPIEVQIEGKKQVVTQSGDLLVPSGTHMVTLSNGAARRSFRYKLGPDSEAYWFINESPLKLMGDGVEVPN